eukprot:scaffold1900_cov183-Ochromonas_danica.AAC.10
MMTTKMITFLETVYFCLSFYTNEDADNQYAVMQDFVMRKCMILLSLQQMIRKAIDRSSSFAQVKLTTAVYSFFDLLGSLPCEIGKKWNPSSAIQSINRYHQVANDVPDCLDRNQVSSEERHHHSYLAI